MSTIKRYIAIAIVTASLVVGPAKTWAQDALKAPLSYSLRDYGVVLSTALLGGLVGWYAKVRRGEIKAFSLITLIGELCTSAFAGLIAFWLCEWAKFPPLLTAALVGISGHAGTAAIARLEKLAEQRMGMALAQSTTASTVTASASADPETPNT